MLRLLVASALLAVCLSAAIPDRELDHYWQVFKKYHGKTYGDEEEMYRRVVWEKNVHAIHQHNMEANLGLHSYTLGINKFSDLTGEEYKKTYLGFRPSNRTNKASHFLPLTNVKIPDEVDWRKEGYVTPVKDQGQCGSCWAFSTTGSVEGQLYRKTKKLVSLSEQNLVDCSTDYGNMGCNGGLMDQAFEYIIKNHGIDTEDSYPYEAVEADCRFKPGTVGATVTGYTDIPQGDEEALKQAVATVGPISVAIDANSMKFHSYHSGVYDNPECSSTQLDHGVLVVGYGTYEGKDYWLVKNSWATAWGMDGYIMMSRNKGDQCGIATQASYPLE